MKSIWLWYNKYQYLTVMVMEARKRGEVKCHAEKSVVELAS